MFRQVAILLTCHSFEDFPVFHEGRDADSLLACWTALWHPAFIADSGRMPGWHRIEDPPHSEPRLLLVARPHADQLEAAASEKIEQSGSRLVVDRSGDRQQILEQALSELDIPDTLDDDLVADFLALGFAYLQIEILTRHMRYATQVAETAFEENLLAAAQSALQGDDAAARSALQSCYDFLSQERDHYYAVDVYLLDISLLTDSLLGEPLQRQLQYSHPQDLLLEARLLETLQSQHPHTYEQLREAVSDGRVGVLGGEFRELPLSLVASDTIRQQLEWGRSQHETYVGRRPQCFARRTFGLTPSLPQILLKASYTGALHATFDGGRFPEGTQSKSRWQGNGEFGIDAILRPPLDASQASTFLKLASRLSDTIDTDHIATRCLVHWAGQASPWYDDLQRIVRFTQALGRFVTAEQYFEETFDPGMHDSFRADQYRSPYLVQQVDAERSDPISVWPRYWRNYLLRLSRLNASTLRLMIENDHESRAAYRQAEQDLDAFHRDPLSTEFDGDESLLPAMATALTRGLASPAAQDNDAAGTKAAAHVLLNPLSFPRRLSISDAVRPSSTEPPVYCVKSPTESGTDRFVADMPALGLSVLPTNGQTDGQRTKKQPPPVAEGLRLRNEFLDATVDEKSGGLRGFRSYNARSNQFSQQLTWRRGDDYSTMIADDIQVVAADTLFGQINATGRLVDGQQQTLAKFCQSFRLWRGSRVLEVAVDFDPQTSLGADPWTHYVGARFAWANEASDLARCLNEAHTPTTAKRFEAPHYIQIDPGQDPVTILTGGLPFHVRSGRRMLDTLMMVKGESARAFRFGVGMNVRQPLREAWGFSAPSMHAAVESPQTSFRSAWIFHVDARNVIATTWKPIWQEDAVTGIHIRLCESEGRGSQVTVRSVHPFTSARQVDAQGNTLDACDVDNDQLTFKISPYELVDVEATFARKIVPLDVSAGL